VVSEGGDAVKIFAIAFGSEASKDILRQIAEATGAKLYEGDPKIITRFIHKWRHASKTTPLKKETRTAYAG
jgi:hypothetical protein